MIEGPDVRELVQEADLGARKPAGIGRAVLAVTCIGWSLLQLWYASPLPFTFNAFILNDTEMRALHLALGLFLGFLAYPFRKSSPRVSAYIANTALVLVRVARSSASRSAFAFGKVISCGMTTPSSRACRRSAQWMPRRRTRVFATTNSWSWT